MFGVHGTLMYLYPIIYGGDTVIRLVAFPQILYGHQLPLLQVLIYCALRCFYGAKSIFILMAVISAASAAGIYMLARELTLDRRAGRLAALLYASHPFILYYSRVPYQEPLLFAGMVWGFYFLFRPPSARDLLFSSLLIGLACFSRYEGWIAALIAAGFYFWRRSRAEGRFRLEPAIKALLYFGWAPALWVGWNEGLSPAGTFVLDLQVSWGRLYRSYFVAKSALWWTESAVVLMAIMGFVHSWRNDAMRKDPRLHALSALLLLHLGALVFSGHGIDPDPVRIVTEREAFVPIGLLVLYAGIGGRFLIQELTDVSPLGRAYRLAVASALLAVCVGYSLHRGLNCIAAANADAELKTDYEVARFLAAREGAGLVLAAPLPADAIRGYLSSAEKWSGVNGKRNAERLLSQVETTPLDYQRIVAYSWIGKNRLFSADRIPGFDGTAIDEFLSAKRIDHIVLFSDFVPVKPYEKIIVDRCAAQARPEFQAHNGNKSVSVYAVRRQNPEPLSKGRTD